MYTFFFCFLVTGISLAILLIFMKFSRKFLDEVLCAGKKQINYIYIHSLQKSNGEYKCAC